MFEIPNWLQKIFKEEKFSCPSCGIRFNISGVVSIGIKNVDHKKKGGRTMLWVEYLCKECGQRVGYEIQDMDLRELSDSILAEDMQASATESISSPKTNKFKKSKNKVKSKITQVEVKQMKKFLDESKTFDEFLDMIGSNDEDLSGKFKIGPEDVN